MILTIDLPEDRATALRTKALEQGVSAEEYARQVLEQNLEFGSARSPQPISELMREIWGDMPEDVRATLPRDGASQIDHYLYGLPKRDH